MSGDGIHRYQVNEIFYSVQGEGMRAGEASVFVRLSKCNMRCAIEPGPKSPGGFDCDTEFESGTQMTSLEIRNAAAQTVCDAVGGGLLPDGPRWVIFTGGEPALQLDVPLLEDFRRDGWKIAVETNGSIELPRAPLPPSFQWDDAVTHCLSYYALFDWIVVSPKVAEHAVRQPVAHELRYVRGDGQGIPQPKCRAVHKLISPAFLGDQVDQRAVAWCQRLVLANPTWRLSVQLHKSIWRAR